MENPSKSEVIGRCDGGEKTTTQNQQKSTAKKKERKKVYFYLLVIYQTKISENTQIIALLIHSLCNCMDF